MFDVHSLSDQDELTDHHRRRHVVMMMYGVTCFEEISISLTIDEERPNGTQLIDLQAYFRDQRNELIDGYQREFLHSCDYFYFGADPTSQWLIFVKQLDREQLCPFDEQCQLICQFYLKREQIKLVQIHLALRDLNDHRGRFLKRTYFYELDEHLPRGFRLQLEQVYDEDFPSHHKSYHLNYSSLDVHNPRPFPFDLSFDSTQHLLELILVGQLDVHRQSSYHLQLIANDEDGQVEDQCHIEIAIRSGQSTDSQQMPPFQHSQYHFHVDQSAFECHRTSPPEHVTDDGLEDLLPHLVDQVAAERPAGRSLPSERDHWSDLLPTLNPTTAPQRRLSADHRSVQQRLSLLPDHRLHPSQPLSSPSQRQW